MLNLRVWLCDSAGVQKRVLEAVQPEVGDAASSAVISFHLAESIPTPFLVQVEYTVDGTFLPLTRNDLFKIDEADFDHADPSGVHSYSGAVYPIGALAEHWVVANATTKDGKREFVGPGGSALSAGAILLEELLESKDAGWAPAVSLGFTVTHDANGVAWAAGDKQKFSLRVPSSQSELLRALVEQSMCEIESRGLVLRALRPGTTRDRTNVVLGGSGFSRVPVKTSTQDRFTRLHVKFDGGGFWLPVPGADESFGTVDALLTLQGVADHASAMRAAQAHLEDAKTRRQESYEWTPAADGWVPWRDFQVGDTVTGLAGGRLPRRVLSMKVREPESGGASVQVTVGETILSADVRRAKLLGSVTVGTIISGSGSSFPSSPPAPDAKPLAPLGVVVGSNVGRWADDGTAISDVELSWAPVVEADDGTAVSVQGYEVWSRSPSGVLSLDTSTATAGVVVSSWEPGKPRVVAVRAQSVKGVWGSFSTEITVTPAVPASIVPKPVVGLAVASNTAVFVSDGRSVATVAFSWSAVTQSTDSTPVDVAEYELSYGGETQRVTGLTASVQVPSLKAVTVKVRALTTLGVWGDYSAPLTVTGASPAVNLPAPSLTIDGGMGGVLVGWNGLLGGSAVPAGFARTVLEVATAAAGPWKVEAVPWTSAGSQSVAAPVGESRWVRARAFDTLGRPGAYSTVVSAVALGVPISEIPGLGGELSDIRFTADGKNRIYVQAGSPGAAVESRRNLLRRTRNFSNSQAWSANGGGSGITYDDGWLLVTPTAPNADTFADIDPSRFGGLKPSTTYTIMARLRVYAGSTGTGTQTNSLWMYVAGSLRGYVQPPGVNVPGEYEVRVTFATPASLAGLTSLRLYSGRTAPSAWTDIAFVEGAYDGPFFDGSTPPAPGKGYAWSGTPNASESIEYTSDFAPGDQWWVVDPDGVSLTGVRMWNGTGWVSHVIVAEHVIATGSITGVLIAANTLRVDHVEPNFGQNLNLNGNGAIVQIGGQLNQTQADLSVTNQAVANVKADADAAMGAATTAQGTALGAVSANQTTAALAQATAQALTAHKSIFQVTSDGGRFVTPDGSNALVLTPVGVAIQQNGIASTTWTAGRMVVPEAIVDAATIAGLRFEKSGTRTLVKAAS